MEWHNDLPAAWLYVAYHGRLERRHDYNELLWEHSGLASFSIRPLRPGWTAVNIWVDGGQNAAKNGGNSYYNHQYLNFTSAGEWYYFRINEVTAPAIAGRYFFKMLLSGDSNYLAGPEGTARNSTASFPVGLTIDHEFPLSVTFNLAEAPTQFIPTENWPVMLVKGEIDPAIITGTIRYAGYNQTLYSQPVQEAGRVYAKMTTRLDPYTGQARPDLPKVDAVAYFNATAKGHYEVEGIAPGVYDLYSSAMGYPQTLCNTGITILKGQSLHFDGYLQPGPVIHGNVFTKHQFGDEPWPIKPTGGIYLVRVNHLLIMDLTRTLRSNFTIQRH